MIFSSNPTQANPQAPSYYLNYLHIFKLQLLAGQSTPDPQSLNSKAIDSQKQNFFYAKSPILMEGQSFFKNQVQEKVQINQMTQGEKLKSIMNDQNINKVVADMVNQNVNKTVYV